MDGTADVERRRERLRERYRPARRVAEKSPAVAVITRFNDIDGSDLSLLISLELFTTIIP